MIFTTIIISVMLPQVNKIICTIYIYIYYHHYGSGGIGNVYTSMFLENLVFVDMQELWLCLQLGMVCISAPDSLLLPHNHITTYYTFDLQLLTPEIHSPFLSRHTHAHTHTHTDHTITLTTLRTGYHGIKWRPPSLLNRVCYDFRHVV